MQIVLKKNEMFPRHLNRATIEKKYLNIVVEPIFVEHPSYLTQSLVKIEYVMPDLQLLLKQTSEILCSHF